MSKYIITEAESIKCPYCGKEGQFLHWKHLKLHGKTMDDVKREFPNHPTMTHTEYNRRLEVAKMGTEASKSSVYKLKTVYCIHCGKNFEVPNNYSNRQACQECLDKGLENPDGRTKIEAQQRREKTFLSNYGKTNPQKVEEIKDRTARTTMERHGGIGFASSKLAKKTRATIKDMYGDENIMKTEAGLRKIVNFYKKKYGENITNPMQILEVAKSVSETLRRRYELESQPTKGKTYEEIYGEEKAKQLKEERRISGAKGYKLAPYVSEPQKELYNIVKEIFPDSKLDHEVYYYFLDIAIPEIKLCIEYDGSFWHSTEKQVEHDKVRNKILESLGWKVIRFRDYIPTKEELKQKVNEVLDSKTT